MVLWAKEIRKLPQVYAKLEGFSLKSSRFLLEDLFNFYFVLLSEDLREAEGPQLAAAPAGGDAAQPLPPAAGRPGQPGQVSWDWWRAGHVTSILLSDWSGSPRR